MSAQMNLSDLNKVWEVKALKKPGEEEARSILEKVAKQVQPIMRKHGWKVTLCSEFCPPNISLMGLNIGGGAEVKLRLRRQDREWDFFPYEQILDTMLHELCHNQIGPHNADFYKLLDEIRAECEELMAKGITGTGQGFDLPGRRLGGLSYQQPPLSSLRQNALSAAQKRTQRASSLPSGPQRIGGDSTIKAALSPVQAAAMAAERRLHDDLWCGSESIGCTQEVVSHRDGSSSRSFKMTPAAGKNAEPSLGGETWQCVTCTLINKPMALICEACEAPRPEEKVDRSWSCKFCTLKNKVGVDKCLACGEWRYSYGPPLTGSTPFPGS